MTNRGVFQVAMSLQFHTPAFGIVSCGHPGEIGFSAPHRNVLNVNRKIECWQRLALHVARKLLQRPDGIDLHEPLQNLVAVRGPDGTKLSVPLSAHGMRAHRLLATSRASQTLAARQRRLQSHRQVRQRFEALSLYS